MRKILANDWKWVATRAESMWLAYAGMVYGIAMQFPDIAVHLQAIADATGWGAKAARWIAIAAAIAGVIRVLHQKNEGASNG